MDNSINKRIEMLVETFAKGNKSAFAKKIGTSDSVIHGIINGRNDPNFQTLLKIIQHFPNVSVDWLFKGEGEMFNSVSQQSHELKEPQVKYQRSDSASFLDFLKEQIKEKDAQIKEKDAQIEKLQTTIQDMVHKSYANSYSHFIKSLDSLQGDMLKKAKNAEEADLVKSVFSTILQNSFIH